MRRFWSDGYDETTVAVLTREIGISAPSLYAAFGDKDELFRTAASAYCATADAALQEMLEAPTAWEAVASVVRSSARGYADPATPSGCFVLSEPRLEARRADMEARIAERIERGATEGDVPPGSDARCLAAFVIAVLGGMSTKARDGGSAAQVAAIGEIALAALPRPQR